MADLVPAAAALAGEQLSERGLLARQVVRVDLR
jgi:hypothetical protein